MTDTVPTFVNCSDCGIMAKGKRRVPRTDARQYAEPHHVTRVVADYVTDPRYPRSHKRPICNKCAKEARAAA